MFNVLDLHGHGMSSMSFMKDDEEMLKFLMESDFEYLYLDDGSIGGFTDENVEFKAFNQNVSQRILRVIKHLDTDFELSDLSG